MGNKGVGLKGYLADIHQQSTRGDSREESYYPALKEMVEATAVALNKKNIHVTMLPKKTEAGNPDFKIWDGTQHHIGYIEAKTPETNDLDAIEESEQLRRYRGTFPNLILTNFFEFRLYRNGERVLTVPVGRPFVSAKLKTAPPPENEGDFSKLMETFFGFSTPKAYNAEQLAVELAKRTSFLKDHVVLPELKEKPMGKISIHGFYEAFQKHLIKDLKEEDFADLYSQTITYGLFAARTRSKGEFNRKLAYDNIPQTIGILRDVFHFVSMGTLPKQMEWILDDISEILAVADVNKILHDYYHSGKGDDPIVHFYETFLAKYDPATRERRGVYYTPAPVVGYIVRSLNHILKETFGRTEGFADDNVTVLDPAAGTLTFPAAALALAVEEYTQKHGAGHKKQFIKKILGAQDDPKSGRFFALELMMAPYAIGHMKMAFMLEELGYVMGDDDRFKLYLNNTLQMDDLVQTEIPGLASLSHESHNATEIKKNHPILVVLGNPPYSGISTNKGKWISDLIETYKYVDGEHFGERKHWLQDDYVKFIRFAQWKIDQTGEGVLGFITNHGYLDNPTFRGMRQSLMKSFDEIYLLDLHGNSLKKETCPDGSEDKNVFDIMAGVCIAFFIKKKGGKKKDAVVRHAELWGLREKKYEWLNKHDMTNTKWKTLSPKGGFYFFVPKEEKGMKQYGQFPQITDIFPVNSTGIVTARDGFVIDFEKRALQNRIEMFRNKALSDDFIISTFGLKDTRGWKLSSARKDIQKDERWKDYFTDVLYRPFDTRVIYYTPKMVDWPRPEVMHHMMRENLGLYTCRQIVSDDWLHILATNTITDDCYVSNKTRERGYMFPLYLYEAKKKPREKGIATALLLFEPEKEYFGKRPNIAKAIIESLSQKLGLDFAQDGAGDLKKAFGPEDVFHYIYAVLYSNGYRQKYAVFLRTDFPRIPFTTDRAIFAKAAKLGEKLAALHLLKSPELDKPIAKFEGKEEAKVERPMYDEAKHRVYINSHQYFTGVPKEVWEYQIGGYQVCAKWLKDRKGRTLTMDESRHYAKVVTAIKKAIELQEAVDEIYPAIEKNTIS